MVKMSYYADYSDVVADTYKVPGYRGGSAEKRGRFIPCRGGGTATTYYTDQHNVDEDLTAIVDYSGSWTYKSMGGIACRTMTDIHSNVSEHVASRLIYLS